MPSANVHQQRFMCQALAVKKGDLSPSKLNKRFRATIVKAANSMTEKQLTDFCQNVKGG